MGIQSSRVSKMEECGDLDHGELDMGAWVEVASEEGAEQSDADSEVSESSLVRAAFSSRIQKGTDLALGSPEELFVASDAAAGRLDAAADRLDATSGRSKGGGGADGTPPDASAHGEEGEQQSPLQQPPPSSERQPASSSLSFGPWTQPHNQLGITDQAARTHKQHAQNFANLLLVMVTFGNACGCEREVNACMGTCVTLWGNWHCCLRLWRKLIDMPFGVRGDTRLMLAARHVERGHLYMPRILAAGEDLAMGDRGADVEKRNLQGQTALIVACIAGNFEAVCVLLDCGANIEAYDDAVGATAAMWACYYSRLDIVRLLLTRGANTKNACLFFLLCRRLTERREQNQGEIDDAEYARREEVLLVLIRLHDREWVNSLYDDEGRSLLLHLACLKKSVHSKSETMIARIGQALILKGAGLEARCHNGKTPLLAAIENYHIELVELLLHYGADVEDGYVGEKGGRTPLLTAIAKSNSRKLQTEQEELIRTLLASGASVEARDVEGFTALMHAARSLSCPPEIMKLLLDQKPELDKVTRMKRSALFWAVHNADVAKVSMLLAAGASPNAGESPLTFACRGVNECYRKGGGVVMTKELKTETVRLLLSANANANVKDPEGFTPIQLAKKNQHGAIVVLLEQHLGTQVAPL